MIWMPLLGGALLGLSATIALLVFGRVAGISGVLSTAVRPREDVDRMFSFSFLAGMIVAGAAIAAVQPELFARTVQRSEAAMLAAGLLVGFGARLGGGCTSGHAVCGISRISLRSIVASVTFIATGAVSVFVVQHLLGGAL
jgi:uncharacterized protein